MTLPSASSADERMERLELRIAELEAQVRTGSRRARRRRRRRVPVEHQAERWAYRSEQWLGRVGLGLFFLGLIYLFQYSIEQGWITPPVRVLFGLLVGSAMLWLGLRLDEGRRSFGQILLAGAVAVYYASGWAAFQLFELVGHATALAYMTAVMALALTLSLRRDQRALASLGAAGGFLTPLLLQRGSAPVVELAVYTTLVVLWAAWVYGRRGWRSLLWTYAAGALAALALAAQSAAGGERLVLQGALIVTWALAAAFPFARGLVMREDAGGRVLGLLSFTLQLRILGVGVSTAALLLSGRVWQMSDAANGTLFLVLASGYAIFAWLGTREPNVFARSAAPVGAALYATGTFLVVTSVPLLITVLSAEAFLFIWLGRRERFSGLEWVGHTLFALLALDFAREALMTDWSFLDATGVAQALQIGLLLAASFHLRGEDQAWLYRIGAHLLVLAWLGKELSPISDGRATVTLAWGLYGATLLAAALRWRERREVLHAGLQVIAFSALALAVGKLIAVDLVRVALLWRIVLFMGFGAGLLALSSMFRAHDPAGMARSEAAPLRRSASRASPGDRRLS